VSRGIQLHAGVSNAHAGRFPHSLAQQVAAGSFTLSPLRRDCLVRRVARASHCARARSWYPRIRTAALDGGQHQITTNLRLPRAVTGEFWLIAAAFRYHRPAHGADPFVGAETRWKMVCGGVSGTTVSCVPARAAFSIKRQIFFADGGQHTSGPVLNR